VLERHALLARIDPKGQIAALDARLTHSTRAQAEARRAYADHLERVSARMGSDLRQGYLIDPETGAATLVEKKE
jgi:hypothetical protein